MSYNIHCEDCERVLGEWTPPADREITSEMIERATRTGYLCDECAIIRAAGQRDDTENH